VKSWHNAPNDPREPLAQALQEYGGSSGELHAWITELFRDPAARGAGRALLRRALAHATHPGLPAIGLSVTHGNPARRLYAEHGFREVLRSHVVVARTHEGPA